RRKFLRLMALSGSAVTLPTWDAPFDISIARAQCGPEPPPPSRYGQWVVRNNLPAFVYNVDHECLPFAKWDPIIGPNTRRNWLMVGNQAIRLQGANDGTVALFDETYGLRWLTAPDPVGTGVSVIDENYKHIAHKQWSTEYSRRAGEIIPLRTFGPTW